MSDYTLSKDGQSLIEEKQVALLYHSLPGAIFTALGLALFVVLALWEIIGHSDVLTWMAALIVLSLCRLWQGYNFKRKKDSRSLSHWKGSFLVGALLAGSVWVSVLFFYQPGWPIQYQFMIWIIYPGLITGAMVSMAIYYPAFVAFVSPLMVGCTWTLISLGHEHYGMMTLIIVVFSACVLLVSRRYSQTLLDAMEAKERLAEMNEKLTQMVTQDALTGIPNRRAFETQLQREWGRGLRYGKTIALLILDIDYFKDFNDRFGHSVGDNCLKQVATAIDGQVYRSCDIAARLGGDEFVVLLPESDRKGAVNVAENILRALKNLSVPAMNTGQDRVELTVSIGVGCCIPTTESSSQQLIDEADQALYRVKRAGRGHIL